LAAGHGTDLNARQRLQHRTQQLQKHQLVFDDQTAQGMVRVRVDAIERSHNIGLSLYRMVMV
jgi:hypothetical protein